MAGGGAAVPGCSYWPLSRRTFLTRPSQAGLRVTQLSATWRAGSDMAGTWVLDPNAEPTAQWFYCFTALVSSSLIQGS